MSDPVAHILLSSFEVLLVAFALVEIFHTFYIGVLLLTIHDGEDLEIFSLPEIKQLPLDFPKNTIHLMRSHNTFL